MKKKSNWHFILLLISGGITSLYLLWWHIGEFLTESTFVYGYEIAAILGGISGTCFFVYVIYDLIKDEI